MSTELEALARRAVACSRWRWMPGMQTQDFTRVCYEVSGYPKGWDEWNNNCASCKGGIVALTSSCLPDLSDPATLGCLLALVRDAWEPHRGQDPICSTMQWAGMWGVGARCGAEGFAAIVLPTHPTEAEALVAALEAAP